METVIKYYPYVSILAAGCVFAGRCTIARKVGIPFRDHAANSLSESVGVYGLIWPASLLVGEALRCYSVRYPAIYTIYGARYRVSYNHRCIFLPFGIDFIKMATGNSARSRIARRLLLHCRVFTRIKI